MILEWSISSRGGDDFGVEHFRGRGRCFWSGAFIGMVLVLSWRVLKISVNRLSSVDARVRFTCVYRTCAFRSPASDHLPRQPPWQGSQRMKIMLFY